MGIHPNSRKALENITNSGELGQRYVEVLRAFWQLGYATDRQVMNHLGYPDMNCVRPRITELLGNLKQPKNVPRLLIECSNVDDPKTGKKVRIIQIDPCKRETVYKLLGNPSRYKILKATKEKHKAENVEQLVLGF